MAAGKIEKFEEGELDDEWINERISRKREREREKKKEKKFGIVPTKEIAVSRFAKMPRCGTCSPGLVPDSVNIKLSESENFVPFTFVNP